MRTQLADIEACGLTRDLSGCLKMLNKSVLAASSLVRPACKLILPAKHADKNSCAQSGKVAATYQVSAASHQQRTLRECNDDLRFRKVAAPIMRSQASLMNMMIQLDAPVSTSMMASLNASMARIRLLVCWFSIMLSFICGRRVHIYVIHRLKAVSALQRLLDHLR